MNDAQTVYFRKFMENSKECIINPIFFRWKDSVETTAKEIYKFFQDNPKADYAAFYESLRGFSKTPGSDRSKPTYLLMEEILEYSGLIPPVRAKLCQKIIDVSFGGVGPRTISKILGVQERIVIHVRNTYLKNNTKALYDDFADKYLNGGPKSVDELIEALIRCRKDFNVEYVAKDAARFPDESTVKKGRKKLIKAKRNRIQYLKRGVFNWGDEIDFKEVFRTSEYVEEEQEPINVEEGQEPINVEAYADEDDVYSEYDRRLEAQVITPPAWYIEEVWGKFKLPGIHLPQEMFSRYLSLYEKKRNGEKRTLPRISLFTSNKVVDSKKQ